MWAELDKSKHFQSGAFIDREDEKRRRKREEGIECNMGGCCDFWSCAIKIEQAQCVFGRIPVHNVMCNKWLVGGGRVNNNNNVIFFKSCMTWSTEC